MKTLILLFLSVQLTFAQDWKYYAVVSSYSALSVADIELTQSCIHSGACVEGNPLASSERWKAYAESAAIDGLNIWLAHRFRQQGKKGWFVLPGLGIAAHTLWSLYRPAVPLKMLPGATPVFARCETSAYVCGQSAVKNAGELASTFKYPRNS